MVVPEKNAYSSLQKWNDCIFEISTQKMYKEIKIDRSNLTLMGVPFSDLKTLENTAYAIGTNMFEGFEPTPKGIELIRDYITEKITFGEFIRFAKEKAYV